MHRSLQIPEIIRNIFSLSDDDHEGRKALAQCCLTCRFFYEPAADALWYHLPDLAPLLKCLPEEFVFETNHPDEDTEEEDRDGEALPPEYSKYKILVCLFVTSRCDDDPNDTISYSIFAVYQKPMSTG
jgi:hypothetical protein